MNLSNVFPTLLLALLLCRTSAAQVANVTLLADTPQGAVAMGSTYTGREAFQLRGDKLSSILYSHEFPITVWGTTLNGHVPIPTDWENREGVMQTIRRQDFPEDWSGVLPHSNGLIMLDSWHMLEGDYGRADSADRRDTRFFTPEAFAGFGGFKIKRDAFFLYKTGYLQPTQYQIYYGSRISPIPEPPAAVLFVCLVFVLWTMCRERPHIFRAPGE